MCANHILTNSGAISGACNDSNTTCKEATTKQTTFSHADKSDQNIENDNTNANQSAVVKTTDRQSNAEDYSLSNTEDKLASKAPSEAFKTNVKVHNPPVGRSTFSLY